MKTTGKSALFFLLTCAFSLLLAELAVKAAAWVSPKIAYELQPPWSNRAMVEDPVLGYRLSPYFPGLDKKGYRNESVLEQADILAIGDSFTYGYTVKIDKSWPAHLEKATGLSVYNTGVGGYGPCEHLGVFNELSELQRDLTVVALYLSNDLSDAYTSVYLEGRCPELKIKDEAVLAELETLRTSAALREQAIALGMYEVPHPFLEGMPENNTMQTTWRDHSSLFSLLRTVNHRLTDFTLERFGASSGTDTFEMSAARKNAVTYEETDELKTVFRDPMIENLAIDQSDLRILEGRKITERAILAMQEQTKKRDSKLLVTIIPGKALVYDPVFANSDPETLNLPDSFLRQIELEEQLRVNLIDFLTLQGIEFVDATPDLVKLVENNINPYYEYSNEHPNENGYLAIANAIQKKLAELK